MWSFGVLFILLSVCVLRGQNFLEDPERFWRHESDYAGSETCRPCHLEIYRRQIDGNHARSLRPAAEAPQLTARLPIDREDRVGGAVLTLRKNSGGGGIEIHAKKGEDEMSAVLAWAFGSGVKGITPIGRTRDGQLFESRLTWYESLGGIDFTTGASQYDPGNARESLGRRLTRRQVAECFGCHTTGYDKERQAPARGEMGVGCERCHGPGQEHIRGAASGRPPGQDIFHAGRLKGFAQAQMCGVCHGAPPPDNDFAALQQLETTLHSVRFPSQRIVLSRCFNESFGELSCTTCHDPHVNVADEAAGRDRSCLSCHRAAAREEASVCPVGTAECSDCHMPKERVMRHSLFTDHWIRVVDPMERK